MNCPYCGRKNPSDAEYCVSCGYPLPIERQTRNRQVRQAKRAAGHAFKVIGLIVLAIASLLLFGWGWYKIHFWQASRAQQALYTSGKMQSPTLEALELSDGRSGHKLTFYGDDGDMVYIGELGQSYMIIGGKAEVLVADSDWFKKQQQDIEKAEITLLPVLERQNGERIDLPAIHFEVETPASPLQMIAPTEDRTTVLSAIYQLEMQVVPGSTVLVDGSDVTDMVDVLGKLSVNVAVYPQGDNPISILVRTPNHKETRKDIVLYREKTDISIELSVYTARSSLRNTMTVSGAIDPTATLVVDTPCVPDSVKVNADGSFSFYAYFEQIGVNKVQFHAEKPGCSPAVISFDVSYLPTLSEYAKDAWRMDYDQVCQYYELWENRVFRCKGEIVQDMGDGVVLMNVGEDNLIALRNETDVDSSVGQSCDFFADLHGMYSMPDGSQYPYFIARYERVEP